MFTVYYTQHTHIHTLLNFQLCLNLWEIGYNGHNSM